MLLCPNNPRQHAGGSLGCRQVVHGETASMWREPFPVFALTSRRISDAQTLHNIPDLPPAPLISAVHLSTLGLVWKQQQSQEARGEILFTLHLHLKDQLCTQSCANFVGLETGLKPLCNYPSEPKQPGTSQHHNSQL